MAMSLYGELYTSLIWQDQTKKIKKTNARFYWEKGGSKILGLGLTSLREKNVWLN